MAAESSKETGQDQAESLIDDLIREILNEASGSSESAMRGRTPAASLIETIFTSPQAVLRASMLERLLLAEAFASTLAEALAPALAEALAPHVMKVLEESTTGESADKEEATSRSGERGRK